MVVCAQLSEGDAEDDSLAGQSRPLARERRRHGAEARILRHSHRTPRRRIRKLTAIERVGWRSRLEATMPMTAVRRDDARLLGAAMLHTRSRAREHAGPARACLPGRVLDAAGKPAGYRRSLDIDERIRNQANMATSISQARGPGRRPRADRAGDRAARPRAAHSRGDGDPGRRDISRCVYVPARRERMRSRGRTRRESCAYRSMSWRSSSSSSTAMA